MCERRDVTLFSYFLKLKIKYNNKIIIKAKNFRNKNK